MAIVDTTREEAIRRWPVWFARLANAVIGWTDEYCAGGCGYPVTHRFHVELEKIGDAAVVMGVCSLDGECEREALRDPRDSDGLSYADFRPQIVAQLKAEEAEGLELTKTVRISVGR